MLERLSLGALSSRQGRSNIPTFIYIIKSRRQVELNHRVKKQLAKIRYPLSIMLMQLIHASSSIMTELYS
jgi:hypothetical protein